MVLPSSHCDVTQPLSMMSQIKWLTITDYLIVDSQWEDSIKFGPDRLNFDLCFFLNFSLFMVKN